VGLLNVKVKLELENQLIEGTFRGLVQASSADILLLGNKKSSLLLLFSDAKILSITIKHTDGLTSFGHSESNKSITTMLLNKKRILTERYEPVTKQEAYSILTKICSKYKGSKATIDTEKFGAIAGGFQYSIEENGNIVIPFKLDKDTNEHYAGADYVDANSYIRRNQTTSEPKIIKDGMSDFLSKVLEGHSYERDYWEIGYSGQLIN
jgi:hypothetical protein